MKNKSRKVVIIGAGLAGLTAAYRLQNEGMDVHLYEARNRVGGRVFTVNINGNPAELGGHNISDGGEAFHLHRLIHELDLQITKNHIHLNHHSFFNGEEFIPISQLLKNKNLDPQTLRKRLNEISSTSYNMKEVLDAILQQDDPLYKVISVMLASYEGAPIEKLSPLYAETLYNMLLGGICSAHQGNGKEENYLDLFSIKGGNALLAQKMGESLGSGLHLNMVLKRASKNEDNSFTLTFHDGQQVKADILILAMPCSVYDQITFEENVLPTGHLQNIQSVQYGTTTKILIPFSKIPDTKMRLLLDDHYICCLDAEGALLTSYCTKEKSIFCNESILHRYQQVRSMIEAGFGDVASSFHHPVYAADHVSSDYAAPVGYSWSNDLYAKGSYSYISPGQESLLTAIIEKNGEKFKKLFAPLDNLYFAGEHASILMEVSGTMEAACESGERTARAILKNR